MSTRAAAAWLALGLAGIGGFVGIIGVAETLFPTNVNRELTAYLCGYQGTLMNVRPDLVPANGLNCAEYGNAKEQLK